MGELVSISTQYTRHYRGEDSCTRVYEAHYDAQINNEEAAYAAALVLGLPPVGGPLSISSNLFLESATGNYADPKNNRKDWVWTLKYSPPPSGQDQSDQHILNPFDRPPVINIEWIEITLPIDRARNVQDLPHGDGKGGDRPANTLGPIVNAAGSKPTVPQTDTFRNPVLTIQRNFQRLHDIYDVNRTYNKTTNVSAIAGFGPRTLKYHLTESQGKQSEVVNDDEIIYWPGTSKVEIVDGLTTTDLELDNVGFDVWDPVLAKIVRYQDPNTKQYPGMPQNLKLTGEIGGDNTTTITWRHLTPVSYKDLLDGI